MNRVQIKFFSLLRLALGISEIELEIGSSIIIKDLFEKICNKIGEEKAKILKDKLFEGDKLKEGVIILLNGENILHLEGLLTKVNPGDSIAIFPPGGGG